MKLINWYRILGHKNEIKNMYSPCYHGCYHKYVCKRCGKESEWKYGNR